MRTKLTATPEQVTKIAHLQLRDIVGNKTTLVCRLVNGSVEYSYFSGWNDQGPRLSLAHLGEIDLPLEKKSMDETRVQFQERIVHLINQGTTKTVFHRVDVNVYFLGFDK